MKKVHITLSDEVYEALRDLAYQTRSNLPPRDRELKCCKQNGGEIRLKLAVKQFPEKNRGILGLLPELCRE
jgi:hypothetical protein